MTKKKIGSLNPPEDLRRQAEEIAQNKILQLTLKLDPLSSEEQRQMFHELRVHQIELEMQNESLRRTQEELESSRMRYFNLYDLAPVGYFTLTEEGLILEANLTAGSLLGMTRNALVKKTFNHFIFREDQDIYYHHRKQLFETGAPQVCKLRLMKKDSSLCWVQLESTIAQDSETEDTLCYTIISDIMESKLAEETLRRSERNLAAIINASKESILLMDLKGKLLAANESLAQYLGMDLETLLQGNLYEFLPPKVAKKRKLQVEQVIKSGRPLYFEDERFERIILNSLCPIFDSVGKVSSLAAIGMDITERKQADQIHSEKMAIAGQLAAGVAHEFNNLLSIIGGSAEYAKGIRNENEIKNSLEVIVKSANRGAQVVKKLLTFTKRIELKKESADLIEVMEEVIGLVDRDLENHSITVVKNYADIPRTLIDIGQIHQVFLNLIINAKNAMPKGKGGKIVIKVEREGKFIKIQFHNTGKPINKEDLTRLFTPFFVTSRKQKNGIPGTGLGLAVSYGIIKAHHGVIKAESEKSKGTTFTILLPITKTKNMEEILPKEVNGTAESNKKMLKPADILIVDDEVEMGQLFKKVLNQEGYSVTAANSGKKASNLCRKTKFDLIYLDIIMPGMDGISVFKKIKEISPKTKIVFFTGKLIEDKVAAMCLEEGAAGFLRKPVPLKELVSYTQNILKDNIK